MFWRSEAGIIIINLLATAVKLCWLIDAWLLHDAYNTQFQKHHPIACLCWKLFTQTGMAAVFFYSGWPNYTVQAQQFFKQPNKAAEQGQLQRGGRGGNRPPPPIKMLGGIPNLKIYTHCMKLPIEASPLACSNGAPYPPPPPTLPPTMKSWSRPCRERGTVVFSWFFGDSPAKYGMVRTCGNGMEWDRYSYQYSYSCVCDLLSQDAWIDTAHARTHPC